MPISECVNGKIINIDDLERQPVEVWSRPTSVMGYFSDL